MKHISWFAVVDVDDVAPAPATCVHLNSGHIRPTKNNLENKTRTMDHHNPLSQPGTKQQQQPQQHNNHHHQDNAVGRISFFMPQQSRRMRKVSSI